MKAITDTEVMMPTLKGRVAVPPSPPPHIEVVAEDEAEGDEAEAGGDVQEAEAGDVVHEAEADGDAEKGDELGDDLSANAEVDDAVVTLYASAKEMLDNPEVVRVYNEKANLRVAGAASDDEEIDVLNANAKEMLDEPEVMRAFNEEANLRVTNAASDDEEIDPAVDAELDQLDVLN